MNCKTKPNKHNSDVNALCEWALIIYHYQPIQAHGGVACWNAGGGKSSRETHVGLVLVRREQHGQSELRRL